LTPNSHYGDVPQPISWLGMEKQNLTQQKPTFINDNKCTTTPGLEVVRVHSYFGAS